MKAEHEKSGPGRDWMGRSMIAGIWATASHSVLAGGPVTPWQRPLEPGDASLHGYLAPYVDRTVARWTKERAPYSEFARFFTEGRPTFAAGEMWGKAVRSACLFDWHTRDPELKSILQATVHDLLTRQRENGSISCDPADAQPGSAGGDLWERKYAMLGLIAYYRQVEADPVVLKSLRAQVDCLIEQIGPPPKVRVTDVGWSENKIESSTLLDPVMALYELTNDPRYLEFARYIISEGGARGYDLTQEAIDRVPPHRMAGGTYPKAYEMLSFFEGLAAYHRATGDERAGRAVRAFFESVRDNEITIVGSGGSDAPYHEHGEAWGNTAREQANPDIKRMMETCVGVTWMKFCALVAQLWGDVSAIDMFERTAYNVLIGAQKPSCDQFSYMNRLNGVKQDPSGWAVWVRNHGVFTCCSLNGPMGIALIPTVTVMQGDRGPVVNLFEQGTYTFQTPAGHSAKLSIISTFPKSGQVTLRIEIDKPEAFDLHVRIPGWSTQSSLALNGCPVPVQPGAYAKLEQTWSTGDEVRLELDMRCRRIPDPKGQGRQAVVSGPIVLARDENMDRAFDQPVGLVVSDGIVTATQETPFYDSVGLQFAMPTAAGGTIRMIDYASCDNWNGRRTCTWMPDLPPMRQNNKIKQTRESRP